jgi:hypothetical protein
MQKYIGTKVVEAKPNSNAYHKPGYAVHYADGYASWSPEEAFNEAYRTLDAVTFGDAVYFLKRGGKVARAGWNGKGMFLYLVGADAYPAKTAVAKAHFGEDAKVPYKAYIAMKTVDEDVVPWLASQTDVLAEDWVILEEGGSNG